MVVVPLKLAFAERWIVNPVSLVALSVQVRSTWFGLKAVATRFDGAAGGARAGVVADAVFDQADGPTALKARTR